MACQKVCKQSRDDIKVKVNIQSPKLCCYVYLFNGIPGETTLVISSECCFKKVCRVRALTGNYSSTLVVIKHLYKRTCYYRHPHSQTKPTQNKKATGEKVWLLKRTQEHIKDKITCRSFRQKQTFHPSMYHHFRCVPCNSKLSWHNIFVNFVINLEIMKILFTKLDGLYSTVTEK